MNNPSCSGDKCGCRPITFTEMVSGLDTRLNALATPADEGESTDEWDREAHLARLRLRLASNIDAVAMPANLASVHAGIAALGKAIAIPPTVTATFNGQRKVLAALGRRYMAWRQRHPAAYARAYLDATPEHLRWDLRVARHLGRFRAALVALRATSREPRQAAMLHLAALATARVNRWRAPAANPTASSVALVTTRPSHGPPLPA